MKYEELMGDCYEKGVDFSGIAEARAELLLLVRTWREKLGPDRGLLDQYLAGFLRAMTGTANVRDMAEAGLKEALPELRGLLRAIKDGNEDEARKHPFYPQAKAYVDAHPAPQDDLYYETCFVRLLVEYAPFAARRYMERRDAQFQEALAAENLQQLREALLSTGVAIMAEGLDYLHSLIGQLFVFAPPSSVFMQGMFDHALLSLITQDNENGAYLFQRLLDGSIE
jgi:hypothetical protein